MDKHEFRELVNAFKEALLIVLIPTTVFFGSVIVLNGFKADPNPIELNDDDNIIDKPEPLNLG